MRAHEFQAARAELNLTQPQMGAKIGRKVRAVRYYETGQRGIPEMVEWKIKQLLGVKRAREKKDG